MPLKGLLIAFDGLGRNKGSGMSPNEKGEVSRSLLPLSYCQVSGNKITGPISEEKEKERGRIYPETSRGSYLVRDICRRYVLQKKSMEPLSTGVYVKREIIEGGGLMKTSSILARSARFRNPAGFKEGQGRERRHTLCAAQRIKLLLAFGTITYLIVL